MRVSIDPVSSGSRNRSSIWAVAATLAFKNDSFDVFSSKSPHQVGHAGQDRAIRSINPHAVTAIDKGTLDQVAHAVQRLQLVRRTG